MVLLDCMHRVNPKHRRAAALRFVTYGVTMTLTVLTTVLLLYIALGYRFDGQNGRVVRSGLLLVDSNPEAASVFVNNELKDTAAPSRFVLAAGDYDLKLQKRGYRDWSKKVNVSISAVREVNYPLMIPTKLTARKLAQVETPSLISQSKDRKLLLSYINGQSTMLLTELDPQAPKQTSLNLSSAFTRENGQLGTFRVVEWALNNKFILLEHTSAGGKVELISLNVTKPEEAVNITTLYGVEITSDIHYAGGDINKVYSLSGGILKRYNLETSETETILQDVVSYQPYADDTILFTRTNISKKNEVGIWQDKITTVIRSDIDPASLPLLKYASFDQHFYFVIALSGGNVVTVYRDPLKKPILSKQLPLTTFEFDKTQNLSFSSSSQFIMVQNGSTFKTYDLDDFKLYTTTLPYVVAPGSIIEWADGHHVQVTSSETQNYIIEYDGQNQQTLVTSKPGTKLFYADNYQHLYRYNQVDTVTSLDTISLVNNRE